MLSYSRLTAEERQAHFINFFTLDFFGIKIQKF